MVKGAGKTTGRVKYGKLLGLRLTAEFRAKLDRLAKNTGLPLSRVARTALEVGVAAVERDPLLLLRPEGSGEEATP